MVSKNPEGITLDEICERMKLPKTSAYDIVTDVFSLPGSMKAYLEQEGMSEGLLRKFQEAVSRTPYLDFDKKTGEQQTDLFLTAV